VSFLGLCNRRVTVQPMDVLDEDDRGNETRGPGAPIPNVPARRRLLSAEEDRAERSEQARTFHYSLALESDDGTPVMLTGRDRIIDTGETLEVLGAADSVAGASADHHLELRAYIVEG
jgi:hypothetical protein